MLKSKDTNEIKVVDFGIAGVSSNISVDNLDAGSLRYMAPEVIAGKIKRLEPSIDVWAMGVILYSMLCGCFPFDGNNNKVIMDKILDGNYALPKDIAKNLSPELLDVFTRTLEVDPKLRITTVELLNHPWIQEKSMMN